MVSRLELVAELLYLKRAILTSCMMVSAEEPLKALEALVNDNLTQGNPNLIVNKYYVKALLRYDEFQLSVETKTGYQGLLLA